MLLSFNIVISLVKKHKKDHTIYPQN